MTSFHQRQHGARNAIGRGLERLEPALARQHSCVCISLSLPPSPRPPGGVEANLKSVALLLADYTRTPFDHHRLTTTTDSLVVHRGTPSNTDSLTHRATDTAQAHRHAQAHLSPLPFFSPLQFSSNSILFYSILFSPLRTEMCTLLDVCTLSPLSSLFLYALSRVACASRSSAVR